MCNSARASLPPNDELCRAALRCLHASLCHTRRDELLCANHDLNSREVSSTPDDLGVYFTFRAHARRRTQCVSDDALYL
jgi:hypothetical protein